MNQKRSTMQIGAFSLTRSATIVSFDEAKRSSRAARSRAQRSARAGQSSASSRPLVYFDPGADARFVTSSAPARGRSSVRAQRTGTHLERGVPDQRRASRSPMAQNASAQNGFAQSSSARKPFAQDSFEQGRSARRSAPSWYKGPDERALREETARRAQIYEEARELQDEEQSSKASPKELFRRLRAKRKADKVFGRDDASASAGEGGPRAALYKGEMGSSQRRASRMQDGSSENPVEGVQARRKRGFSFGPKMRVAAAVAACLALVCVFLYQPAQQYYQAMREHDALSAEYAALQARGDALQDSVDTLSSDAGIEDLAHDQYGWVKEGEVSVSVSGVDSSSGEGSSIPPNVSSGSVEPPDTWYSGILDPLFGVE